MHSDFRQGWIFSFDKCYFKDESFMENHIQFASSNSNSQVVLTHEMLLDKENFANQILFKSNKISSQLST